MIEPESTTPDPTLVEALEAMKAREESIPELVRQGLRGVASVVLSDRPLCYSTWRQALDTRGLIDDPMSGAALFESLWKFLIQVPQVGVVHELSLDRSRQNRRDVLPAGARLSIELDYEHRARPPLLRLRGSLSMRRGKSGRLECCPVGATLSYFVENLHSLQEEADLIGVSTSWVNIEACSHPAFTGRVDVEVRSLNQAYTLASRRLQQHRRSHTGNIYDKISWTPPTAEPLLLEEVRLLVESGEWNKVRQQVAPALDQAPSRESEGETPR